MNIIIHAPNVHQGGGRVLLSGLISAHQEKCGKIGVLDARMRLPHDLYDEIKIKRINPSIIQRLIAEWWLARNTRSVDVILCFGNLPPLFKLRGYTFLFIQNRYLVKNINLRYFPLKTRLRISIERLWLSLRSTCVDEIIVQTPSMKNDVESKFGTKIPVCVMPYTNTQDGEERKQDNDLNNQNVLDFDFLYVASAEPHKNHRRLIESWCLLAEDKIYPSLCLTINETTSPDLCSWIAEKKEQYGLNITNLGHLSHDQTKQLYHKVKALIYPSKLESLGLPLIEAKQVELPILAAELDYVRDLLDPEESFDPESAISISRAVKRFMKIKERPIQLLNATEFIDRLLKKQK